MTVELGNRRTTVSFNESEAGPLVIRQIRLCRRGASVTPRPRRLALCPCATATTLWTAQLVGWLPRLLRVPSRCRWVGVKCCGSSARYQSINQITMRVLSPMREVALVKSILQTELLIYVAKCLMSFNVTKRTVNQSYSSISSWVFLAGAFLESLHHRSSWSLYCYSSPLPFASSSAAASSPYPTLPPVSICP